MLVAQEEGEVLAADHGQRTTDKSERSERTTDPYNLASQNWMTWSRCVRPEGLQLGERRTRTK